MRPSSACEYNSVRDAADNSVRDATDNKSSTLAVRPSPACDYHSVRYATDNDSSTLAVRPSSACDYHSVCDATEHKSHTLATLLASACDSPPVCEAAEINSRTRAMLSEVACDYPTVRAAAENDYKSTWSTHAYDSALCHPTVTNAIVPTTTVLRKQSVLSLFLIAFAFITMISHSFRFRTVVLLHAESNTTLLAQTTFMVSLYDGGSCDFTKSMGTLPGRPVPLSHTSHTFSANVAGQQNDEFIAFTEALLPDANDVCFDISDVATSQHFSSPSEPPGARKVNHSKAQGAHKKTITFESVLIKERVGLRPENILQSDTDPKATGYEKHTHVDVAIEAF